MEQQTEEQVQTEIEQLREELSRCPLLKEKLLYLQNNYQGRGNHSIDWVAVWEDIAIALDVV